MTKESSFSTDERATLHVVAEMFERKEDRDALRNLIEDGATLSEIITAYRSRRFVIASLKGTAALVVTLGAAYGVLRGLNLFPK